jgi:Ferritin-like domain
MRVLDIETIDTDGAIRETQDEAMTRSTAVRRAAAFGGAFLGGGALLGLLAPGAKAAGLAKSDLAILNYALTLEYLESAFYAEALAKNALSGELKVFATVVGEHEAAHVAGLKQVLGSKAVKSPKFDFQGTTADPAKFAATAQVLEDTGVAAYKGQAPLVKSNVVLVSALSIHAVEARHAGWIRAINGAAPAPDAFDQPLSMKQVLAAVAKTKFIKS